MSTKPLVLEVHVCHDRRSVNVKFYGTDEQASAALVAFVTRKQAEYDASTPSRGYTFHVEADTYSRLSDEAINLLFPLCHHGMDAGLCMDPIGDGHFGTREQELARGW